MHKEVIHGRKVPAIMISIITITIALYIVEIVEISLGRAFQIHHFVEVGLLFVIILVLVKEFKQSRMTYKYSIIADKLIINRLNAKGDDILESIKMQDIVFFGKKTGFSKKLAKVKCHGSYLSCYTTTNKYYCVYKREGRLEKFNFEPSERLIKRINDKIDI